MADSALEERLSKIRESLRCLCKDDCLSQLDELCSIMDTHDLPAAARLFIFDQGLLSVQDLASKHQQLTAKVEEAVNLGFSVKCMKDFVQVCATDYTYYDYPMSNLSLGPLSPPPSMESAPAAVGRSEPLKPKPTLPPPPIPEHPQPLQQQLYPREQYQQLLQQQHQLRQHQQFPQQHQQFPQQYQQLPQQSNRNSSDAGYGSLSDQHHQQPHQTTAKSRSCSVDLKPPAMQHKQQSQPTSPSKSPGSKPGLLQLFLFPEKAKKSNKTDKQKNQTYTT